MSTRILKAAAIGCTVLVSLLCVGPAGAANPHPPDLNPVGPFALNGLCPGFDVIAQYTRSNEYVIHDTTAPDGTVTESITGAATISLTNVTTGKTVTYNASGPGTITIYPDGSVSLDTTGPSLLWTAPQLSYPGVPTIAYTTGPVHVHIDGNGMTSAYTYSGHQTDVCQVLAA